MARLEKADARQPSPRNFYDSALSESERLLLEAAAGVDGLADEVAALRVRLSTALRERPDDLQLALYGMNTLMRMVVAQYRLSPRASKELADNLTMVLNNFADQLVRSDQ